MDNGILITAISAGTGGIVALATVVLTNAFTRHRDQDADWRRVRFDLFKEYVAALSGIVEGHHTIEGHRRHVDAVNALPLVASSEVITALYDFLEQTRCVERNLRRHDEALTSLMTAMRRDLHPGRQQDLAAADFHLITLPPHLRADRPAQQT